jgi:hypothetical protein
LNARKKWSALLPPPFAFRVAATIEKMHDGQAGSKWHAVLVNLNFDDKEEKPTGTKTGDLEQQLKRHSTMTSTKFVLMSEN